MNNRKRRAECQQQRRRTKSTETDKQQNQGTNNGCAGKDEDEGGWIIWTQKQNFEEGVGGETGTEKTWR